MGVLKCCALESSSRTPHYFDEIVFVARTFHTCHPCRIPRWTSWSNGNHPLCAPQPPQACQAPKSRCERCVLKVCRVHPSGTWAVGDQNCAISAAVRIARLPHLGTTGIAGPEGAACSALNPPTALWWLPQK
jgi:hypothetical protein